MLMGGVTGLAMESCAVDSTAGPVLMESESSNGTFVAIFGTDDLVSPSFVGSVIIVRVCTIHSYC